MTIPLFIDLDYTKIAPGISVLSTWSSASVKYFVIKGFLQSVVSACNFWAAAWRFSILKCGMSNFDSRYMIPRSARECLLNTNSFVRVTPLGSFKLSSKSILVSVVDLIKPLSKRMIQPSPYVGLAVEFGPLSFVYKSVTALKMKPDFSWLIFALKKLIAALSYLPLQVPSSKKIWKSYIKKLN